MSVFFRGLVLSLVVAVSSLSFGQEVIVENDQYKIAFHEATQVFRVYAKECRSWVVPNGRLNALGGTARQKTVRNQTFGRGKAMVIEYPSGDSVEMALFDPLPFVYIQSVLNNTTGNEQHIKSIQPLHWVVDLGTPVASLRSYGTAGLTNVARSSNPGSYSFLGVVEPESRNGMVCGWLSHERGSGLFFSDVREGQATIDAQLDFGHLQIKPGAVEVLEPLLLGWFADARDGLEGYADAVARHHDIDLPPQPSVYCTWYHARASNETDLIENSRFANEQLTPYGFSVVQIDDGWQHGEKLNGPKKDFTQVDPNGPYPSGMKQTADNIKSLGLEPGIWFMPFAGTWNDPFFADKQDFFARKDGKPFEVHWGGTCFDMTNPRTQQYVHSIVNQIADAWGYTYFKLDGLWTGMAVDIQYIHTGYKDDRLGETKLSDPATTHVQAYRDGLRLVREAAGKDVFLLGCNVAQNMRTLGGSFGLLDAMRIGPDNGRNWPSMCRGPFSGSNLYFLHHRVWYNDPDPIYVRESVPLSHARALTSWVALTGQLNASSIQFDELPKERLQLLQKSIPAHTLKPRPVDLFEERIPRAWLLTDDRAPVRRDVIGLFNWEENEAAVLTYPLARLGLPEKGYLGFDYWGDTFVGPFYDVLESTLEPASCRILAVKPVRDFPQLLGTSRHITQGVMDVVQEAWEASTQTLQGRSRVVGGDVYQMRIAAMGKDRVMPVKRVSVSTTDQKAGVSIRLVSQDAWKVRVEIKSGTSREVSWRVHF